MMMNPKHFILKLRDLITAWCIDLQYISQL